MLWILAFHVIAMVAWFAGLFYLPRLFVYHADAHDSISQERFKIMERKLFWMIMTPAAVLTTVLGLIMLIPNWPLYSDQPWMIGKLALAAFLCLYHVCCGFLVVEFKHDRNPFPAVFYRFFNEIPTLLLIGIIIFVIVKP
ncbi:MAG: CopD family protein [Coxiellaceae bacterium]|nr:CopD family protein [Coxiellaceae bacterium]